MVHWYNNNSKLMKELKCGFSDNYRQPYFNSFEKAKRKSCLTNLLYMPLPTDLQTTDLNYRINSTDAKAS